MPSKGTEEKKRIIQEKFTFCLFPDCHKLQGENGVCDYHRQWIQNDIDDGASTLEDYVLCGHAFIGFPDEQPDYPRDLRSRPGPPQTCLMEICNKASEARGLCANHYAVCYLLIQKGEATWEILEEKGFALPVMEQSIRAHTNNTLKSRILKAITGAADSESFVPPSEPASYEEPPEENAESYAACVKAYEEDAKHFVPQSRPACFGPEPTEEKEEAMPQLDETDRHLGRKPPVPIPSLGSHPAPSAPPVSLPDSVLIGQQAPEPQEAPQSDPESKPSKSTPEPPEPLAPPSSAELAYLNAKEPEEKNPWPKEEEKDDDKPQTQPATSCDLSEGVAEKSAGDQAISTPEEDSC